jgi:phosphate/sulfate permease
MSNTFKRKTANAITTSLASVYTVPAATTAVVIGGVASNTGTGLVNAEIVVNDGSNDINLIGKDTPIPAGTALSFIDGKVVLETGDVIKAKGSVASQLDVMLSIMEIT